MVRTMMKAFAVAVGLALGFTAVVLAILFTGYYFGG